MKRFIKTQKLSLIKIFLSKSITLLAESKKSQQSFLKFSNAISAKKNSPSPTISQDTNTNTTPWSTQDSAKGARRVSRQFRVARRMRRNANANIKSD